LFFNRETFLSYLRRIHEVIPIQNFNENTIAKDFNVFVNMYKGDAENSDIEDSFSGVLSEIGLLKTIGKGKEEQFQIENNDRDRLPDDIVLYAILDNADYGNSISLNILEYDNNSPGTIFALNRSGLMNKISGIIKDKAIVFTDHAGIKELQFKNKPNAYSILDRYYGK
jgi:hypothetical protein